MFCKQELTKLDKYIIKSDHRIWTIFLIGDKRWIIPKKEYLTEYKDIVKKVEAAIECYCLPYISKETQEFQQKYGLGW